MNVRKGLTLLELVIVMAIIGMTVISVPPVIQWLNQQGVRHAVDQIRADLQSARIMAIRRRQTCALVFNHPGPNQYANAMNNKIVNLSSYRGGVHFMRQGPDHDAMSARISFSQRGITVPAADVYLADGSLRNIYRIRVLVPGGISIFRWNGADWQ